MEQTLGKRIIENRKLLGLTQDRLAEKLGVTAQAVSKWENDQSCPDITTLPKLAEIFGITTDELLGIVRELPLHQGEVVPVSGEDDTKEKSFEFQINSGQRDGIGLALWALLSGGLLLASNLLSWDVTFWDICWPSGLLVFGILGLWPKFSFFRLSYGLLGGYVLAANLGLAPFTADKQLLLPVFLLLFGLYLLTDALKKENGPFVQFHRNGSKQKGSSESSSMYCDTDAGSFSCSTSFCENRQAVTLPVLREGRAECIFGELEVDLSGCNRVSKDCRIRAECSFGDLSILVPRRYRVDMDSAASFGSAELEGSPVPEPDGIIRMDCETSFGAIRIRYI